MPNKIATISTNTKDAIKRKSAYSLPDRPSDQGMKPEDIKRAFWQPTVDVTYSTLTEIDRVIDEINNIFNSAYDAHIANTNNPHAVTKVQVGLGHCDDTADIEKPVSTPQKTAISDHDANIAAHKDMRSLLAKNATDISTEISDRKSEISRVEGIIVTKQGTTITENGKALATYNIDLKADKSEIVSAVQAQNTQGTTVTISDTNNGFVDKIAVLGNTIGGNGTPSSPIALQSVASHIVIKSIGKNLFDKDYIKSISAPSVGFNTQNNSFEYNTDNPDTNGIKIRPRNISENTGYTFTAIVQSQTVNLNVLAFGATYTDGTAQYLASTGDASGSTSTNIHKLVGRTDASKTLEYIQTHWTNGKNASLYVDGTQLEVGSVATAYEPYKEKLITINVRDVNGVAYPLRKIDNTYCDRIFKDTDYKWYLEKKVGEASVNITTAMPNSLYLGTMTSGGIATASGGITVKSGETINYALATPEKILLNQTEAQKLETIATYNGATTITSTDTIPPIFDVTELRLLGEHKPVVLKDSTGTTLDPHTCADVVTCQDGKTVEDRLACLGFKEGSLFEPATGTTPPYAKLTKVGKIATLRIDSVYYTKQIIEWIMSFTVDKSRTLCNVFPEFGLSVSIEVHPPHNILIVVETKEPTTKIYTDGYFSFEITDW